jgi:type IV pilus modification protein PilV
MKDQRGFTMVEIIIAIIVLTVGLLGLVSTSALVTRMIGRGQRSAMAANFAQQRLERMRAGGCIASLRVNGSDTLYRGGSWLAINTWSWVDEGASYYRIRIITTHKTQKNFTRTDTAETGISCLL